MRRTFNEAEEEYKFQLARMGKQVQEKSSTDTTVYEKH